MDDVPNEILAIILSHSDVATKMSMSRVNKTMHGQAKRQYPSFASVSRAKGQYDLDDRIEVFENGNEKIEKIYRISWEGKEALRTIKWYRDGILRREDAWYSSGVKMYEKWYDEKGNLDRKNKPAYQQWYPNGKKEFEYWYKNGNFYRRNGPNTIEFHENGEKSFERWAPHPKIAVSKGFYENGNPKYEIWLNDDMQLDRKDGPAEQNWNENGELVYEGWWKNDERHRTDGPALIRWENGKKEEIWYNKGEEQKKRFFTITEPNFE